MYLWIEHQFSNDEGIFGLIDEEKDTYLPNQDLGEF
jgi:hypothetical protein